MRPGNDDIPGFILKLAWASIKTPLLKIFNTAIKLSYFPENLKSSIIITIQKPGAPDLSQVKSIRPISLLPHNGDWFLSKQFGFNSHHSTELANFNVISHIQHTLNQKGKD